MNTLVRTIVLGCLMVAASSCRNVTAAPRAAGGDALIARTHFVGADQLFAGPDSARLKEIWNLPGTAAFRTEAVTRISALPAKYFGANAQGSEPLRPLVEDLLKFESYAEFRATPEMVLAIKLPENRAKAWDDVLRQATAAWKLGAPAAANAEGFIGWEVKRRQAPQVLRVGRMGDWTVVTCGPEKLTLAAALQNTIKNLGRPAKATGAWLDGSANLARLRGMLPVLSQVENLPVAHFSLSNRADFVRSLVKLEFATPHKWKAEPWLIPTNSIYDPVISFTAARGIAPLFASTPMVSQSGWSPVPSQFCGWGLRRLPFQFYYTTPVRDVTNQLRKIGPKLQSMVSSTGKSNLVGRIVQNTNTSEVYWQGLPLAVPRLAPLRNDPNFLAFEMFPLAGGRAQPPTELFQQLSRENLVYYDWEITEDRIPNWRQFYQIAEIATQRQLTPTNTPASRLIIDVAPKLGECVTEITATSPTDMTMVRKSHLGLNSFELVTLSRWMESTNFPQPGVFPPQQSRKMPGRSGSK